MKQKSDKISIEMLFSPTVAIFTLGALLAFSLSAPNIVFADVISPYEQIDLNFTPKEVVCKESLVKITRDENSQVACVSPETAVLLADRGFVEVPNPERISEVIKQQSTPD